MCKTDVIFLLSSHLTACCRKTIVFQDMNRKCVTMLIKYISHDDKHEIGQQITNSIYHTL